MPGDPGGEKTRGYEVIEVLAEEMLYGAILENIRWENGPEFVAEELGEWLANVGGGDAVHRARESLGERLL